MKQGEVWLINLDPTIGAEIKKTRPAVIVSSDGMGKLPLCVIVPITEWKQHYTIVPWMIQLEPGNNNGLDKESSADCFQVRTVSKDRFVKKLGFIEEVKMDRIKEGLRRVFEIR